MPISLATEGRVARLLLDRPERLNAADDEMLDEMLVHLEKLTVANGVDVLVLTGAGRAFSAGGDLRRPAPSGTRAEQVARLRQHARSVELLRGLPQVTVAAVNGACAGLGVGWAAACSLRVLATSAVVNTAYLAAGLSGDFGVAWLLTRLVGAGTAADWLLRPRKIPAAEARGFASVLAPADAFDDTVAAVVEGICSLRPEAVSGALVNLREAEFLPLPEYLDRESGRHVDVRMSR
ncbi:enoyl-CoA hydratase/isomerase family protein [Saccharopolyspora sp. K220]|uniref:enoyl-CoA hydratase/isomerase family protein n=1 Tax=Saccharopolyspora soli TaxID=2926618 RepID=UPI001F575A70|nr:enoyl-CoA hydratase/isomerase family protein [Saccharopolyspora soli]MCI2419919.1 enoyl-CoA hydratase/isomerase family protein [Saccharopolyspora soli]